jgi:phosphate transport system protein
LPDQVAPGRQTGGVGTTPGDDVGRARAGDHLGIDPAELVGEPPSQGLRSAFHTELDQIRAEIARLSATVTEDILRATDILLTQDLSRAEAMIVADDEFDARCIALEQRCYRLLALQAPVAIDLRQIVAAMRIIAEVERSADLAVNVCKAGRRMYGHSLQPRMRGLIRRMAEQASRLFREAGEAYLHDDATRAAAVADMDDLLDDLQRQFVAAIFDSPDTIDLSTAVQLAVLARFYERIGDHAVTIGERVRYLVTGRIGHDRGRGDDI